MTTGIPNVNNLQFIYQILTLVFLLLFAIYDFRHHRIRNTALAAFLIWCLFSIPLARQTEPAILWYQPLLKSGLGFITGFMILFCVALVTNGGIGGGDIKLIAVLGILYGAWGLLAVLMLACISALLLALIVSRTDRLNVYSIPFAPFIFAGSLIYTLPQLIYYF